MCTAALECVRINMHGCREGGASRSHPTHASQRWPHTPHSLQGAAGKTATAPLETIKMQLVQSHSLGSLDAMQAIWRRAGLRGFFRRGPLRLGGTGQARHYDVRCAAPAAAGATRWMC